MKPSYAFLLILPVLALLASGCTTIPGGGGGGGAVSGAGIVINTFEPSLTSIESADPVRLHLEVQNRGDVIGTATAVLMGITTNEWGSYTNMVEMGQLLPADVQRGTQGGKGQADWNLVAPDLQKGETRTYIPMARVYYSYEQNIVKPITFLTSEELRNAAINGETPTAGATLVSAGPLSVIVNAGQYVRTKEGSSYQSYFPVEIRITNSGGGTIAGGMSYPIGFDIVPPMGTQILGECPAFGQTPQWTDMYATLPSGLTIPTSSSIVELWNGRETTVTCRIGVTNPPAIREDRDLRIKLSYIYFQDAQTTLNVVGTTEGYIY